MVDVSDYIMTLDLRETRVVHSPESKPYRQIGCAYLEWDVCGKMISESIDHWRRTNKAAQGGNIHLTPLRVGPA